MKKYALIGSALALSMTSNCVASECRGTITYHAPQLTAKAQKRISQKPLIPFFLTTDEIKELQTIETTRSQISKAHTTVLMQMSPQSSNEENNLIFRKMIDLNIKRERLTHQLDIVQKSKNFEILENIKADSNIENKKQKPEKPCDKNLLIGLTALLNWSIDLHQDIVAIEQFNKNKLYKYETIGLFESIQNNCFWHKNNVIVEINFFVDQLESLQQEQETSDK